MYSILAIRKVDLYKQARNDFIRGEIIHFCCVHCTVLHDVQFAVLNGKEIFLEKPFLLEKSPKIHKICGFGFKKSSKFKKHSNISICTLVPQIDLPVALWRPCAFHIVGK